MNGAIVISLVALALSGIALYIVIMWLPFWLTGEPVSLWRKWKTRFGVRGIKGWFIGQYDQLRLCTRKRRLCYIQEQYTPVPSPRKGKDLTGTMYGALGGRTGNDDGGLDEWNPPACSVHGASPSPAADRYNQSDFRKMPSYSHLTDEELDEALKTGSLGSGLYAEKGYRDHLKMQSGKL